MSEPRRLSNPPEGERKEGEERESECNKDHLVVLSLKNSSPTPPPQKLCIKRCAFGLHSQAISSMAVTTRDVADCASMFFLTSLTFSCQL